jgi:hypothetical protein
MCWVAGSDGSSATRGKIYTPVRQVECGEVQALLEAEEDVCLHLALLVHHHVVIAPAGREIGRRRAGTRMNISSRGASWCYTGSDSRG